MALGKKNFLEDLKNAEKDQKIEKNLIQEEDEDESGEDFDSDDLDNDLVSKEEKMLTEKLISEASAFSN